MSAERIRSFGFDTSLRDMPGPRRTFNPIDTPAIETKLEDPLVVVDTAAKRLNANINRARNMYIAGHVGSMVAVGSAFVIVRAVDVFPGIVTYGLAVAGGTGAVWKFRGAIENRMARERATFEEQAETAYQNLKETGIEEDSLPRSEYDAPGISEREVVYHLARRARNTKLLLAQRGRLGDYQQFKWIDSAAIPKELKPTQEEIDEVNMWAVEQRKKGAEFVSELARRQTIWVECGDEFLKESTRVFLFKDPKDVWKYETMPLMDVMTHWGATDQERRMVGVEKSWRMNDRPYEGIQSKIGRQRVADFFGKPVNFYSGGAIVMQEVDTYGIGIKDLDFFMDEGLVHFLYIRNAPGRLFFNPCANIDEVEPSAQRASRIGLETINPTKVSPRDLVVAHA